MKRVLALLFASSLAAAAPTAESVALAMLTNIRENGTNPSALGGLGGLWVNWRTSPQLGDERGHGLCDDGAVFAR